MLHFFRRIGAFFRSLWHELTQKKEPPTFSDAEKKINSKLNAFLKLKHDVLIYKLTDFRIFFSQSSYKKALSDVELEIEPLLKEVSITNCEKKKLTLMLENEITALINNDEMVNNLTFIRAMLFSVIPELASSIATKMHERENASMQEKISKQLEDLKVDAKVAAKVAKEKISKKLKDLKVDAKVAKEKIIQNFVKGKDSSVGIKSGLFKQPKVSIENRKDENRSTKSLVPAHTR